MLIRFHVSNYLSFNEEVEFSMVAGKVQHHFQHVYPAQNRYDVDVLKAAVVYGPNASGKSNLIRALDFARDLIVQNTKPKARLLYTPFKLSQTNETEPTKFEFELKIEGKIYIYGFLFDAKQFVEEWLYEVRPTKEEMLFERKTIGQEVRIELGFLDKSISKEEQVDWKSASRRTRPNQLFLAKTVEDSLSKFEPIYTWFQEQLVVIFPHSEYIPLAVHIHEKNGLSQFMEMVLEKFGTGICGFALEPIEPQNEFPPQLLEELLTEIEEEQLVLLSGPQNQRYLFRLDNHQLKVFKLMFEHKTNNGTKKLFNSQEESDGTLRLLDLVPVLYNSQQKQQTIVIDELDRSLHPHLSYAFLEQFLQINPHHSQLIVTTHESNLLDFNLLRRDEIWFVEKDPTGASHLFSLEEFTPRADKDIRKGYLLGRYGAIPVIGQLAWAE